MASIQVIRDIITFKGDHCVVDLCDVISSGLGELLTEFPGSVVIIFLVLRDHLDLD